MTRVAVVGMGLMGMLHARVLSSMPGVEVVAAVDIAADRRAAAAAQRLPVAASVDGVLDDVDALIVSLPDHLHVDACVTALSAGKYVLVEKPLATTVADAERIVQADSAPGRLMVGHLLRFDPRLMELRARIRAGELGALRYVRIHRANTAGGAARLGGRVSVTAFLGVHDLDVLLWLTGADIESVDASGRQCFSGQWDLSVAHLGMSDGSFALVENHWLIHDASPRSCLAGVQVFGDAGMALVDLSTGELELATDALGGARNVDSHNWAHDQAISSGSLRREIETFIHCVRTGSTVPISGADGLRAVDAVARVERALGAHS